MKSTFNMDKGLLAQVILLIVLIILMIISIFNKAFLGFADIVAGLLFFLMAYNKRNTFTKLIMIIFVIFGILFLLLGVYNFING